MFENILQAPKVTSKPALRLAASLPALGLGQQHARFESLDTDLMEVTRLRTQLACGTLKADEITDVRIRRIVLGDEHAG